MTRKYLPLEQYLQCLPPEQQGVILTFQEIEQILDNKLPRSAYTYQKWWTHESQPRSPQKQAFRRAGWRLCTISMSEQRLQFIRQEQQESRPVEGGSLDLPGGYPGAESPGEN
jgi:hypothetical protein